MRLLEFTRDATAAKAAVRDLPADQYLPISDTIDGERFAVAGWSRYSADYDAAKLDSYLRVSTKLFGECTAFMLSHTINTGIGKIITYRDQPRYVLDPGRKWRSYLAARFGISRKQYSAAAQSSRLVERLIEQATAGETSKIRSITADLHAAEELLEDMAFERASIEQEVRSLRGQMRQRAAE